jgi:hypothetical protein
MVAHEDVDLAKLDLFDVVEVTSGPKHDEQRVVITFDLGPLMRVDRILDGQRMQLELGGEPLDLVLIGSVQADPGHTLRIRAETVEGFVQERR